MNWVQDEKAWVCQLASLKFRAYPDSYLWDQWYWEVYNGRDLVDSGATTTAENAKQESEDDIRTLASVLNAALKEINE